MWDVTYCGCGLAWYTWWGLVPSSRCFEARVHPLQSNDPPPPTLHLWHAARSKDSYNHIRPEVVGWAPLVVIWHRKYFLRDCGFAGERQHLAMAGSRHLHFPRNPTAHSAARATFQLSTVVQSAASDRARLVDTSDVQCYTVVRRLTPFPSFLIRSSSTLLTRKALGSRLTLSPRLQHRLGWLGWSGRNEPCNFKPSLHCLYLESVPPAS